MPGVKKSSSLAIRVGILICFLILSIQVGKAAYSSKPHFPDPIGDFFTFERMVLIPAGEFEMGSDEGRLDEAPAHQVYLDAFWLDQFEVSNQAYAMFLKAEGRTPPRHWESGTFPPGQASYPVVGVRWKDAQAYCDWAGKRLPTEAEWEKACRGPNGRIYPWGDFPDPTRANVFFWPAGPQPEMWDAVWDLLNSPPSPGDPNLKPVGSFPTGASPYGIHDQVGNASEWVADYYNWDGYWDIVDNNPLVLEPAWNHVLRGSAWFIPYGIHLAEYDPNRCSARSSSHGDTHDARTGFRCARSVD